MPNEFSESVEYTARKEQLRNTSSREFLSHFLRLLRNRLNWRCQVS
jgi:hypothetical protein